MLAGRIRAALPDGHISEKRMFGGITFLVNGNMLCCASKQGLMVRVGKEAEAAALSQPFARPCLGTGRRMAGFILLEPVGISEPAMLCRWLNMARAYVDLLPPKIAETKRLTENELSDFSPLWHDDCVKQSSRHKMWTEITRRKYERGGQRYASDLTDGQCLSLKIIGANKSD
jgi:hypothetical protein